MRSTPLRQLFALLVFAAALTDAATTSRAQAQTYPALDGGDPPLRLYGAQDIFSRASGADIAIASDGTQILAYSYDPGIGDDEETVILRSTDGGDSWETWDVFREEDGSTTYTEPQVEIIGRGGPSEQVVVAYRLGVSGVEIAYADPADAVPVWTVDTAMSIGSSGGFTTIVRNFDVAVGADGDTVVGVAAAVERDDNVFEYFYNVSLDPVSGFGNVQSIHTIDLDDAYSNVDGDAAIAFHDIGGDDRVTMFLSIGAAQTGLPTVGEILITSDTDFGTLETFDPVTTLATRDYRIGSLDAASDPVGDTLILVTDPTFEAFVSENGGTSWSPITMPTEYPPGLSTVRFDSGQFVILGEPVTTRGVVEYRPIAVPTGPWSARTVQRLVDWGPLLHAAADDPTRPGETAVVSVGDYRLISNLEGVWYNGTWRDAPGYGVLENPGFFSLTGDVAAAPAIGDLDGDGLGDFVFVTVDDFDGESNLEVFDISTELATRTTQVLSAATAASAPALTDVDDDGDLEIFIGSASGGVEAFDHDLNPLYGWPVVFPESGDTWVSIGVIGGYVPAEIVATNAGSVHLLNAAGLERPGWPYTVPSGTAVGRAALGDVDDDGAAEIVAAFTSAVVILEADGSVQRALQGSWTPASGVSLADVDDDGDLEIAIPMEDGIVALVHHDGTLVDPAFPYVTGVSAPVSSIAIADLVDFGVPVLTFTVGDQVHALGIDGVPVAGYPYTPESIGSSMTEPIVARVARPDVQRPQILFGSDDGLGHIYTASSVAPRDWPRPLHGDPAQAAATSDVDGDGINELVFAAGDVAYLLDTGTEPLANPSRRWPQAGHDNRRSGCSDCAPRTPTSVEPTEPVSASIDFHGASPNPATGTSSFAFSLSTSSSVSLQVFDARGRLVRELVSKDLPAGTHRVAWDSADARGRLLASGTYFARLSAGEETVVRRIAVVR